MLERHGLVTDVAAFVTLHFEDRDHFAPFGAALHCDDEVYRAADELRDMSSLHPRAAHGEDEAIDGVLAAPAVHSEQVAWLAAEQR